jgi:proteic killer suppression protein
VDTVETEGLAEARKVPGYHDEPLHGEREGERAIRLSRSYRAIYVERRRGGDTVVMVREVTKHAY